MIPNNVEKFPVLYCTVKCVTKTNLSTRFILDSASPNIDDDMGEPFYTSVTTYGKKQSRFFADYEGPPENVNYIDLPCNVEQVDSFPSPIPKK